MRTNRLLATGVLLAATLAVSACGATGESNDAPEDLSLTIGLVGTTPANFDTSQALLNTALPNLEAVFDRLLRPDEQGVPQGSLATAWEYDSTRTALTLELRDDVSFTDGTPFDAEAAKANLEFFRDGGGGESALLAGVTEVEAPDATTVVIHLDQPDPGLLISLAGSAGFMASPAALGAPEPVGSGPYVLDTAATVSGSEYVYDRNEDYWGEDLPYSYVSVRNFESPTSLLNALQAGQVNSALLDATTAQAAQQAGFENAGIENEVVAITLLDREGEMTPALADVRVRQALNYAVDRDLILKNFGYGLGTATSQMWPASNAGFNPELDTAYTFDPEKARELLAEAGYPDGFELTMPRSPAFDQSLMTTLQQMFADVGVTITYQDVDRTQLFGMVREPTWSAFYLDRWVMVPDWQMITSYVGNEAVWNLSNVSDPEIGRLTQEFREATDESEIESISQEINQRVVDQAFYVPLYRKEQQNFHDDKTKVTPQPYRNIPALYNFAPAD